MTLVIQEEVIRRLLAHLPHAFIIYSDQCGIFVTDSVFRGEKFTDFTNMEGQCSKFLSWNINRPSLSVDFPHYAKSKSHQASFSA